MSKSVKRLGIYGGRKTGDWAHCPMRGNDETRVRICRECDFFEGVERQDKSNPFNYERVVLCSYKEGGTNV